MIREALLYHLPVLVFAAVTLLEIVLCIVFGLIHLVHLSLLPIALLAIYGVVALRRRRREGTETV